jgi:PiT family inorganic phosphate transporter
MMNLSIKNYKVLFCLILSLITSYVVFINFGNSYYAAIGVFMGLFMALNIGANDVANNLSASIGANAMTLKTGIIIAIIFEFSGAMIAGGNVTSTIKKGIIDPSLIASQLDYIWIMIAALTGAGGWLTYATSKGYPVSTTHSIVGGVMGAGMMYGFVGSGNADKAINMVDWLAMSKIAGSWLISPVIGGVIAYSMFSLIKSKILYANDSIQAAKEYVPVLIAAMSFIFSTYLILKGLKKIWPTITTMANSVFSFIEVSNKPGLISTLIVAFVISVIIYLIVKPIVVAKANKIDIKLDADEKEKEIMYLFIIPIIASAAALCFAHGSNDVANAIGPLAGIIDAVQSGEVHSKATIPTWVMLVGAGGLVVGLALFGAKMVQKIGSEVVELTIVAAFSVNFSAALTVVIASQFGLPVSSTHIALGAIVGVGFYSELKSKLNKRIKKVEKKVRDAELSILDINASISIQAKKLSETSVSYIELDTEYDTFKFTLEEKKVNDETYHKTTDEEVKLKRFNRDLKHLSDKKLEITNEMIPLDRELVKQTNDHRRMLLGLAGVKKETYIERGFAKKIALTWIVTVPAAIIISGSTYALLRGVFSL